MTRLTLRGLRLFSNQTALCFSSSPTSLFATTSFHRLSSSFVKMADRVHRVTMFKVPDPENQKKLIEAYKKVNETNQKDGKPYILSVAVGQTEEDPRSQGYTVVCKTEFSNMDHLKFYDDACPAHQELKGTAKTLGVEGIMTVYFKPSFIGGSSP